MYIQSPWKQKEDTRSPGAGVTISCKPPGAQQQAFLIHDCLSRPSIGILSGLDGLSHYFTLNSHKRFLFPHNFLWLGWLKGLTIYQRWCLTCLRLSQGSKQTCGDPYLSELNHIPFKLLALFFLHGGIEERRGGYSCLQEHGLLFGKEG